MGYTVNVYIKQTDIETDSACVFPSVCVHEFVYGCKHMMYDHPHGHNIYWVGGWLGLLK